MTRAPVHRGAILLCLAVVACSAGSADETAGDIKAAAQDVRACEVLTLEAATRVIGTGTEQPGDTEQLTCIYSNPGVAMLTIQLGSAAQYDQITIMQPHAALEIGDRGRSNVQQNGAVAVQFVKGAHSATLSLQPLGAAQADYLEPLVTAAREAAGRLP